MRNIKFIFLFFFVLFVKSAKSQAVDVGIYRNSTPGFYNNVILKDLYKDSLVKPELFIPKSEFKMDFSNKTFPTKINQYKTIYHSLPVSQGRSGTCWAYAASSLMESETYRKTNLKVKLSEMFIVYWEYVDRAIYFVENKGKMHVGEGSESNAILRHMKNYGLMPFSAYNGLPDRQIYNNHDSLFSEFNDYLINVKNQNLWDKELVVDSVKRLLNKYIGTPPQEFIYEGNSYTSKSFMRDYLNLNPNEYFSFMSTKANTYYEQHQLLVDDNWWCSNEYFNIPLNDYMELINTAITSGYSISICGDVSEPGYDKIAEVAVISSFDIPSEYINQDAREFRLVNKTTSDDHCIHIVGHKQTDDGKYWYLIKDSGSGAYDGENKGYRFYHEDYIKLKVINIVLHADMAKQYVDRNIDNR